MGDVQGDGCHAGGEKGDRLEIMNCLRGYTVSVVECLQGWDCDRQRWTKRIKAGEKEHLHFCCRFSPFLYMDLFSKKNEDKRGFNSKLQGEISADSICGNGFS